MTEYETDPDTRYKVGRVLSEHGLSELHEELPQRWTGEGGESMSLRELADQINVALVAQAMADAGEEPLTGEAENAYRLLTDENVSEGVRTQQRNRLNRVGVNIEALESQFVTHQAVHTYLTDAMGVSKDSNGTSQRQKHEERIQRLRNRTAAVVEGSITDLQKTDEITAGTVDVSVDILVYCQDCGQQAPVSDFLDNDGCGCE